MLKSYRRVSGAVRSLMTGEDPAQTASAAAAADPAAAAMTAVMLHCAAVEEACNFIPRDLAKLIAEFSAISGWKFMGHPTMIDASNPLLLTFRRMESDQFAAAYVDMQLHPGSSWELEFLVAKMPDSETTDGEFKFGVVPAIGENTHTPPKPGHSIGSAAGEVAFYGIISSSRSKQYFRLHRCGEFESNTVNYKGFAVGARIVMEVQIPSAVGASDRESSGPHIKWTVYPPEGLESENPCMSIEASLPETAGMSGTSGAPSYWLGSSTGKDGQAVELLRCLCFRPGRSS